MTISSSDYNLSESTWHKSSYSGGDGGDCLEVATGNPGIVPVRDSKVTGGPALVFRTAAWSAFVTDLKRP
ncbi:MULTISPECIES: DUF397 domain-containing protein [Streptomyces]|uniref:DUF397 domain-containing protein n=1 Tax=Streptomyces TaxID=1883 RepID=UPI000BC51B50|nr:MULTISPECIES: DUF397 domain-containing protein [Streptomyces]MBD2833181.1 DUF397 domain-containing protein [Streptomyces pratensis]RAS30035.1 uncharacterized protein DUF397 [Streptomyces avidinii]SNX77758.1 protein of unknown function [Streptomyces microflavus]MYT61122.1 DUF397 domain-containing protein [Streptomyces sp. SID7834]WJY32869.1 DUF397 domain-containing protein [Streptomyces sp. P9-2B-1]